MMTTVVTGIHTALAEIKARGWDQIADASGNAMLVGDQQVDADDQEYAIDADTVVRLRDGYRAETIWTRADE